MDTESGLPRAEDAGAGKESRHQRTESPRPVDRTGASGADRTRSSELAEAHQAESEGSGPGEGGAGKTTPQTESWDGSAEDHPGRQTALETDNRENGSMENEVLRQVLEALENQERKNAERDAARTKENAERDAARTKENADLRVELEKSRTENAERDAELRTDIADRDAARAKENADLRTDIAERDAARAKENAERDAARAKENAERDAARAKENADLRVELERSRTENAERIGDLINKIVIVSLGLAAVFVAVVSVAVTILVNLDG